jgi:hypothetical protein
VASRGGGRASDVQSHQPELGGLGAGRRLREAGGVGGQLVERVGWRSAQGRRAALFRAGRAWAWGGRAGPHGGRRRRGWQRRPTVSGLVAAEAVQGPGTGRAATGRKAAPT